MVAGSSPVSVAIKKPCFSRENRAFFVLLRSQFLFRVQNFSVATLFRTIQAIAHNVRLHVWTKTLRLCSCLFLLLEGSKMARQPKPWFREDRRVWCVTITGKHHNLGRNKKEAFKKFSVLMQMPKQRQSVERNSMLSTNSSTGISITAQKRLLNGTGNIYKILYRLTVAWRSKICDLTILSNGLHRQTSPSDLFQ